jgi:hypothetical protein
MGSEVGGGTLFGAAFKSQWPALPTQHGIVLALFSEALAIGNSVVRNDEATNKHKKHKMLR